MTLPPARIKFPSTLPVLTEVADEHAIDIPTLTEIHAPAEMDSAPDISVPDSSGSEDSDVQENSGAADAHLSEAACLYLAAQIAPQVDALLQNAIRDIQAKLPELIRTALNNEHATKQND